MATKDLAEAGVLQEKVTMSSSLASGRDIPEGNRKLYESFPRTLGSFPRKVGPAADAKELEYISSLHQNAVPIARLDGTISSNDIAPYLSSRYGMEITQEQAIDIAKGLCGAKMRSEFSAEKDARDKEMMKKSSRKINLIEDDDEEEEEVEEVEDKEEEVYYFDLVQVMSLLLIPELVQFADKHENNTNFLTTDGKAKISLESDEVVKLVIDTLTEIFDEDLQRDLRNGGHLDVGILQQILLAFGDVDSANNPRLLKEMLDALGGSKATLTIENVLQALTSDVRPSFSEQMVSENSNGQTSAFFDIFGFNWDAPPTEDVRNKGGDPAIKKTASFIDYAADSYGSVVLNTAVWSLFILTTLVYLNFVQTAVREEAGGLICHPDKNFGCALGDRVLSWLITALFFGLYGVFFLVPTSIGNVAGKSAMIYVTLLATLVFTYVPFGSLIWYKRGMNHNEIVTKHHRTICPNLFHEEDLELFRDPVQYVQDNFDITKEEAVDIARNYSELGAQMTLYLDFDCKKKVDWCKAHPEVQGRYIDPDEDVFTYEEFAKCQNFYEEWVIGLPPWSETGMPCDFFNYEDDECPYGFCALRNYGTSYSELNTTDYICCNSMERIEYFDESQNTIVAICSNQELESICMDNYWCESGYCRDNVCIRDPDSTNEQKLIGEECDEKNNHRDCKSGFCLKGHCQDHPVVCPVNENVSDAYPEPKINYEKFSGYRLDPYCRTEARWCEFNDLSLLEDGLNYFYETLTNISISLEKIDVFLDDDATQLDECSAAILLLLNYGFINILSEEEAEVGDTFVYENHDNVEASLADNWTYYSLIGIGVVGAFAFLSIARKVLTPNSDDDRPRDFRTKQAGENKIANVIQNALNMRVDAAQTKGQVMRNYFLRGERHVEVGGLGWTLKKTLSGDLGLEEGLRYPGRIWVGQVVQVLVTIVGLSYGFKTVNDLSDELQELRQQLSDRVTQEEASRMTNFEFSRLTEDEMVVSLDDAKLLDRLPEKWMVQVTGYTAVCAGLLVALFCMLVYVPSVTNTILKLRSGMEPSLHDPFFHSYKKAPDNVIQNIGNMIFSLMGASVMMSVIVGVIVAIFVYPISRDVALQYVAAAMSFIKVVGQKVLRSRNFSSFYRTKPTSANYANLFFECWYIGTGLLVVVSRLIKFLISGALWLGRIDVEFLHPNVKVFGIGLDKVPQSFKTDILVHEAHNHPYIERLGGMYLRRCRDGHEFGTVAGTTWRSLFACGLMPWIVKYRVNNDENVIPSEGGMNDIKYTRISEC